MMFRGQMKHDVRCPMSDVREGRRITSPFTFHLSRLFTCFVLLGAAVPALAQNPAQVQQLLQQNPDLIRQRLQQSGLTPDQIRDRLQAAGYSRTLLDPFISGSPETAAQAAVNEDMLRALDALVPPAARAQGLERLSVETGAQPPAPSAAPAGLQLFGAEVFRGRTTQFQPLLTGPVPSNYRIGPGDVMVLVITGDVEFVHELAVTREGFIVIPQVGQLYVNNLTLEGLRATLRDRLGRSYSGIRTGTTKFDVTIARLRTNQVFAIGEVVQPGAYQLASVATTLNALYAAGGPSDRGNFRQIQVRRNGQVVSTLDLYDYLLRGDTRNDVVLEQGDVIFVPVRGVRASVSGAVIRPAIYEFVPGQTLKDLVETAGGFQTGASVERIAIHRMLPPAERSPGPTPRTVMDVKLGPAARDSADAPGTRAPLAGVAIPRVTLEDGDSVVVDYVTGPGGSLFVSVTGMVRKQGSYPWHDGITLKDLVTLARGPSVGADLREAEVSRLPADRSGGLMSETVRVPLDSSYLFERDTVGEYPGAAGVAFPAAGSAPEVKLQPYDRVTIFRQPQFELQRSVDITGEVEYPGSYALTRKDERLSDLVKRAGGFLPTAYPAGARFIRPLDRAGRIDLELARAMERPGSPADVILQPGDSLHVPEYVPTVRVEGAVNSPTSVLYQEGHGLNYYIANAGGYARNADKGRVSVRYANGSARVKSHFLFFGSSPTPGPGSTVSVPLAAERPPFNMTEFLGSMAQILASTVAILVIATKL